MNDTPEVKTLPEAHNAPDAKRPPEGDRASGFDHKAQPPLGCGRFSESEWSAWLTYEEPLPTSNGPVGTPPARKPAAVPQEMPTKRPVAKVLDEHIQTCALCRAEWESFASITFHIGEVIRAEGPNREAFVDGVLVAVRHERQKNVRESVPGIFTSRRPTEPNRQRRWIPRPITLAAVLALFVVLGAGLWSSPWTSPGTSPQISDTASSVDIPAASDFPSPPQITGPIDTPGGTERPVTSASRDVGGESVSVAEVLPGGAILRAVQGVTTSGIARAGALRADGVSIAAGDQSNDLNDSPARTIRITSGSHTATSAGGSDGE